MVSIIAAREGVCDEDGVGEEEEEGEGARRWVVRVWRDSYGCGDISLDIF